jgi:hypothetical protein
LPHRDEARCTRSFSVSKEAAVAAGFNQFSDRYYCGFSCSEMKANLVFKVEPIALTVPMITTEMPAAMRPYSIAVVPDSSLRNATTLDM